MESLGTGGPPEKVVQARLCSCEGKRHKNQKFTHTSDDLAVNRTNLSAIKCTSSNAHSQNTELQ